MQRFAVLLSPADKQCLLHRRRAAATCRQPALHQAALTLGTALLELRPSILQWAMVAH